MSTGTKQWWTRVVAAELVATLVAACAPRAPEPPAPETISPVLAQIREEAARAAPLVDSPWVRDFLAATADLPPVPSRVVYVDAENELAWSEREAEALGGDAMEGLERRVLDEEYYYFTRYGTPVAYARALDLIAAHGIDGADGLQMLDYGYGGIGQLRMLATLGADVVGVEVDPVSHALYSAAGDTGTIAGRAGVEGRVTLVHGSWPGDAEVRASAGGGFDLFLSKNTLKNGYIHPAEYVDPKRLVHLGVTEDEFVAAVFESLAPGGLFVIYNLCPAPAPPGEPYIPWADGRSPFPRETFEAAGFEVLAFDEDDTAMIRRFGLALAWDQGEDAMDLENDLFAWFTIVRRPS
ncbi:MAG: hypothetical protein HY905_12865 [Deltaproteobacteria bacterium]|nr:hypothetical protein [Deltaproteobacteria bacterium]